MAKKKRTVNIGNANTDFKRKVLTRIIEDNVCPFCEEHFLKYHTKPIIKKGKYWILTENFDPYAGSKHHFLAVSRTHIQHAKDLSVAAQNELFKLFLGQAKKFKMKGAAIFMRFGDTEYTGGTVEHLHAHLIAGGNNAKKEPILA